MGDTLHATLTFPSSSSDDQGSYLTPQQSRLFSRLLFAARNLASENIYCENPGIDEHFRDCRECSMHSRIGRLTHTPSCRTGEVLDLIARLLQSPNPVRKEDQRTDDQACAGLGDTSRIAAALEFCEGIETSTLLEQRPMVDQTASLDRVLAAGKVLRLGVRP